MGERGYRVSILAQKAKKKPIQSILKTNEDKLNKASYVISFGDPSFI
jgi:hypothetical protein